MIKDKPVETHKDLYLCFIDYPNAFDKVKQNNTVIELYHQLVLQKEYLKLWNQGGFV